MEARVELVRPGNRTRTSCTRELTCVRAANTLTNWAGQTLRSTILPFSLRTPWPSWVGRVDLVLRPGRDLRWARPRPPAYRDTDPSTRRRSSCIFRRDSSIHSGHTDTVHILVEFDVRHSGKCAYSPPHSTPFPSSSPSARPNHSLNCNGCNVYQSTIQGYRFIWKVKV